MSPVTHFLLGWVCLERLQASRRDKALVVLAGLAPDLDGLGIVVDFATRSFGWPETDYYQTWHRMLGHGLPAALLLAALVAWLGDRKAWAAGWAFVAVHLHFLCDLLGSRGQGAEDFWGIYYWAPISSAQSIVWSGQWPLVSWQNFLISAVLLALVLARATRLGYSPVSLCSAAADREFVATLRRWRQQLCALFGRP